MPTMGDTPPLTTNDRAALELALKLTRAESEGRAQQLLRMQLSPAFTALFSWIWFVYLAVTSKPRRARNAASDWDQLRLMTEIAKTFLRSPPLLASQSGDMQAGDMNVLSKTKIALSAAVVLSATFPTWAATKHHHRVTYARPQMYDAVPDHNSGDCSPVHPPFCSNICTGSGPCAPPDSY